MTTELLVESTLNVEQDLIEMGSVSEETKGSIIGVEWDGGVGRWLTP